MLNFETAASEPNVGVFLALKRVELFRSLDDNTLQALSKICHFSLHTTNEHLAYEGDVIRFGFVVIYGRVSFVKSSQRGREIIVDTVTTNDLISLLLPLSGNAKYQFSVRAQTDSRVLCVPNSAITSILESNPNLTKPLFGLLFSHLHRAYNHSLSIAHEYVQNRIAHALLQQKNHTAIRMTRVELAAITATTPETVSRVVMRLEQEKILDLSEPGVIKILKPDALI